MSIEGNNFFKHTSKELAMDGFLCWLIKEAESNERLSNFQKDFVELFLGIDQKLIGVIKGLKAEKQKNKVDVVITIETNKGKMEVIFENKMHSTVHSNQLKRYKDKYNKAVKYNYLKIGYIHKRERKMATKAGWTIIDAETLYKFLSSYEDAHPFIKEFNEFLDDQFVTPQRLMEKNFKLDKIGELENASFQQFIMGKIYDELLKNEFKEKDLEFKVGSNYGFPWTQLYFSILENVYGKTRETLLFRIDKRANKCYLRVSLYSKQGEHYWPQKKNRLDELREAVKYLVNDSDLTFGKVHDNAEYEMEVLILFFEDGNSIKNVVAESSKIASHLKSIHQKLKVNT